MNKQADIYSPDEVISLIDIWKKLVQYKKVFWCIFFIVLITGITIVLLTPVKYNFSQVIEIGKSPDERGVNTINVDLDQTIKKIRKVFYPAAVRAYNLQPVKKIKMEMDEKNFIAENVGNGTLLLSMNGTLKDLDGCGFVLQKVIEGFSGDTKEYINYRIKTLSDTKLNLERRLIETDKFYKIMTAKYFDIVSKKKDMASVESRIVSMYLNDQNSFMIKLNNNISMLQAQIIGTYNIKVVSDLIVSDKPVSASKFVLLVLVVMAALFVAFFGVFVISSIDNERKSNSEHSRLQ
jgi:hypothetical protein